jgi:hypothetical protein
MDGMTDDRFEAFLQREARDYNAPPPVPRDAMWARIDAERRARTTLAASGGAHARHWWIVSAAIAAMLLLGVGIGYVWRGAMDSRLVAEREGQSPSPAREEVATVPPEAPTTERSRATEGSEAEGTPAGKRPDAVAPSQPRSREAAVASSARRESAVYAAITAEHLGRVETLLTSFRAESESGEVDSQITSWAGDLLGTTRLLIDSPGSSDPRLRKLLGDLELVLTQITQLHVKQGSTKDELQLIDQSLRSHDVMTRIRGATPAGAGALPIGT